MEGESSDDLLTSKAEELQSILTRCLTICTSNTPVHNMDSSTSSESKILSLKSQVKELQYKISQLRQQSLQVNQPLSLSQSQPVNISKQNSISNSKQNELLHIFSYLSVPDLFKVGRVCKKWREASLDTSLWQQLIVRDCSLNSKALVSIATRCSETQHITLQGISPLPARPDQDLKSYINQQKAALETGLEHLLYKCGHCLVTLTISECSLTITERSLWIISKTCPQLQSLFYHSIEFPPTSPSIWSLTNGCTKLQSLHLPPTTDNELGQLFNDSCLEHISQGFPLLCHLTVGGQRLTTNGLIKLGNLTHLQYINIINGPRLNTNSIDKMATIFQSLVCFYLTHTTITPQAVIRFIDTHANLQVLSLTVQYSDYYKDNEYEQIANYNKILSNFQTIMKHEEYGRVFQLKHNVISVFD